MNPRCRDERGAAGSMLIVGACASVCAVTLAGCLLIAWFAVARHAQQSAELAALAGVGAAVEGSDPCAAARAAADHNRAELSGCVVRGTAPHVVVEVTVSAQLAGRLPGAPVSVARTAAAGTLG